MTFTLDRRITGSRIIDESLQVHNQFMNFYYFYVLQCKIEKIT